MFLLKNTLRRLSWVLMIWLMSRVSAANWAPVFSSGGGDILALAVNTRNPTEMYASVLGIGLYRSTDGGNNWVFVETGEDFIRSIGVDPENPSNVYISGYSFVLKSTDSGLSWTPAATGLDIDTCSNFTFAPNHRIYCETGNGIFETADAGSNWMKTSITSDIRHHSAQNLEVLAITVSPINPNVLYAALTDVKARVNLGVYRSSDGGTSWTPSHKGLGTAFLHLVADASLENTVYAFSGNRLYKTDNAGARWEKIWEKKPIMSLAVSPLGSGTVYVGTTKGIFVSRDGGNEWTKVNRRAPNQLVTDGVSPNRIFAATNGGILVSEDTGTTWDYANTGLPKIWIYDWAQRDQNPMEQYLATSSGIFKSIDGGTHWAVPNLDKGVVAESLTLDPVRTHIAYAVGGDGLLYRSTNAGETWKPFLFPHEKTGLGLPYQQFVTSVAVDPFHPETIFAAISVDLGGNEAALTGIPNLYGAYITKTTDGGHSWHTLYRGNNDGYVENIFLDLNNSLTVYAFSYDVLRSKDGGIHWKHVRSVPFQDAYPDSLRFDSTRSTKYVAGTQGIYKKSRGEHAWSLIFSKSAVDLRIDPRDSQRIYALTTDSVFSTNNGGLSWQEIRTGLPNLPKEQALGGLWLDVSTSPPRLLTTADGVLYAKTLE